MTIAQETADAARWDATSYAGKELLLRVIRDEAEEFLALAAVPDHWEAPTASGHWQVRDLVGHMVDVTEGYLDAFDIVRNGGEAPSPLGLRVMAQRLDERATAFRSIPQPELLQRLRQGCDRMMKTFDGLTADEWTGLLVPHGYMGPLPAFFFAVFHLIDYGVHGWDIREGLGVPNGLNGDTADILAPFMFILWQATTDLDRVSSEPVEVGVNVFGRNGGTWLVTVSENGYSYEKVESGQVNTPVTFEFDSASLILTAYGRTHAGTAYGDRTMADRYRSLFFAI